MIKQFEILWLYLFIPQNRVFTLIFLGSLCILGISAYLLSKKRCRATGVAVCLLGLTPFLYSSMLLLKRATFEVSLSNYHELAQKTKRSKRFNDMVTEHLNVHQNRLNGYDYARLEYNWRKLSASEQGLETENDAIPK